MVKEDVAYGGCFAKERERVSSGGRGNGWRRLGPVRSRVWDAVAEMPDALSAEEKEEQANLFNKRRVLGSNVCWAMGRRWCRGVEGGGSLRMTRGCGEATLGLSNKRWTARQFAIEL